MNNENKSEKADNSVISTRVAEGFVMPESHFVPQDGMKGFVYKDLQYPLPPSAEEWRKGQVEIADSPEYRKMVIASMIEAKFDISIPEKDSASLSSGNEQKETK